MKTPPPSWTPFERALLRAYAWEQQLGQTWLRLRHRRRVSFGPGCRVDWRSFVFRGLGALEFGPGSIIERGLHPVLFNLEPESRVTIGAGVWFQTYNFDTVFSCKAGAEIVVGDRSWFSGGIFGASRKITIGEHTLIGNGCLIFDSDLHQLDNDTPLQTAPVSIGSHVWLPAYVTVQKGVTIGDHCVIGAGSLVNSDIPDHSLAVGRPARVVHRIGDRDQVP